LHSFFSALTIFHLEEVGKAVRLVAVVVPVFIEGAGPVSAGMIFAVVK